MKKANMDIRKAASEAGIYLWQIAYACGCTDTQFSRKLRTELAQNEKEKILNIICRLSSELQR